MPICVICGRSFSDSSASLTLPLRLGRAKEQRRRDSDAGLGLLRRAVAAGFKGRELMSRDSDLEAVRGREEFKALLESIRP